jgi:tRNA(Ile)-lysidine synthase
MLSTVARTIATHRLLAPGDRVVVAVSGGPDSMALLHALWELRERLKIELVVAGVDHGLRPEAAGELGLVAERAAALGLPFAKLTADVPGVRARRRGASLQDAARDARLHVLAAFAAERGAGRLALGHQADDQAETVLFRVVRGTGLRGLVGIPYCRAITPAVTLIRPLLDVRRAELLRYLRRRSIPYVDDPSNRDERFARARIRHRVLPALREENPRVVEALLALAEAARALESPAPGDVDPGDAQPPIPTRTLAQARRLRARGGSAGLDLSGGRRLEVAYGKLRVVGRSAGAPSGPPPALVIDAPGTYRWRAEGQGAGRLEIQIRKSVTTPSAKQALFDADRIAWPLIARGRRDGDRMRPRGGRGSRKLADLMIDAKIERHARAALPVVTGADDQVLFVPGLRPAEAARPTPTTGRLLSLRFVEDREET